MDGNGDKLERLEDAAFFENGNEVAFTIRTVSGKRMRVHCSLAELGDIFSYLGNVAKGAAEARNVPTPAIPKAHNYLAPVPAQGIGVQLGRARGETFLVVRLFGFDMAFSVPTKAIARLADEFAQVAHKLPSDDGGTPN